MAYLDEEQLERKYLKWRENIRLSPALDLLNDDDYERLAEALVTVERLHKFTRMYGGKKVNVIRLLTDEQKRKNTIDGKMVRLALLAAQRRYQELYSDDTRRISVDDVMQSAQVADHELYSDMPSAEDAFEDILREKFERRMGLRKSPPNEYLEFDKKVQSKSSSRDSIKENKLLGSLLK